MCLDWQSLKISGKILGSIVGYRSWKRILTRGSGLVHGLLAVSEFVGSFIQKEMIKDPTFNHCLKLTQIYCPKTQMDGFLED